MHGKRLVLASSSARRQFLLSAAGYTFDIVHPEVDEAVHEGESPHALALRLAIEKATAGRSIAGQDAVVLAADTIVVVDDEILGKPESRDDAVSMLKRLAGRSHRVLTGWAIDSEAGDRFGVAETVVRFNPRTGEEIGEYVDRTEPYDKAGAYAIQGDDGWLIDSVSGSRSNVMGLPVREIVDALGDVGVERSAANGV